MPFKGIKILVAWVCAISLTIGIPLPTLASSAAPIKILKLISISTPARAKDGDDDKKGSKGGGDKCESAQKSAKKACTDGNSTEGMSQQQGMQFMMAMAAAAAAGSALSSGGGGTGQMLACALMGPLLMNLAKANGIKGDACEKAMDKCDEACGGGGDDDDGDEKGSKSKKSLRGPLNIPNTLFYTPKAYAEEGGGGCDYGGKVEEALLQMLTLGAALASVMACMKGTGKAQSVAGPSPTPVQTCDDPIMAQTDIGCKCDTKKNPKANPLDPICSRQPGAVGQVAYSGEARAGVPTSSDDPLSLGGSIQDPIGGKPSKGNGDGLSGGGGGQSPTAGGQLQALNQDHAPGAAGKDVNTSIITGQSGGNPMLSPGGGSGGSSGGGSKAGAEKSLADRFNLSKFIPKKDFLNRGVAGMSIPAVDGVTGPSGPSIWEKNSTRYQAEDQRGGFTRGPLLPARMPAEAAPAPAKPAGGKTR